MFSRIITLGSALFLCLLSSQLMAQTFTFGPADTVTGCSGCSNMPLVVPSDNAGTPVTRIANLAFANLGINDTVTIPNTITDIGQSAFLNSGITAINIPSSATTIGIGAFASNNITSVSIPATLTVIPQSLFVGNSISSLTIPSGVTRIGASAFANNSISSLSLPSTLTRIDNNAFQNNSALTTVSLPSSLSILGQGIFSNCGLTSVTIANGIPFISPSAFLGNNLTSVSIPSSVTTIGSDAFRGNSISSVSIPSSVTGIFSRAFRDNGMTSVTLSSGLETLDDDAFANNSLSSLTIPDTVTVVRDNAFANNALSTVAFDGNRPIVFPLAFAGNSLTTITYISGSTGWPGADIQGVTPTPIGGGGGGGGGSTPEVSVSAVNSVLESEGPVTATVTIDSLPSSTASVELVSTSGTPNPASSDDFEEKTVFIVFDMSGAQPGTGYTVVSPTSVTVNFGVVNDTDVESDEVFDIFLNQESGLILSSIDSFQNITIVDDDSVAAAPPQISVSPQRSFSEDSGEIRLSFSRSGDLSSSLSFDFATVDSSPLIKSAATSSGTATAGSDYTSVNTTVSWAAGESGSKSISIPLLDDNEFEGDETFSALASNLSSGASFGFDPSFVFTIAENEIEPAGEFNFSEAMYEVNEDAGSVTITVIRSGGANGAVSVNYSTADGSATAGSDYSAASGTLSWAAGDTSDKTFVVSINEDILNEASEDIALSLSSPSGTGSLGSLENSQIKIINVNEEGAPDISKDDISVTDFDGDGLVEVVLDATGKIISDNPINDVSWLKEGEVIATGMVTKAELAVGTHPLRVIATDSNGKQAGVDFIAEVKELDADTTRMLSDTGGLNTEQGTVAGALDELCPRLSEMGQQNGLSTGQTNLRNRCESLRDPDLSDEDIVLALDQIAGEEAEAIIITAARFTNMHQSNLRNRFTQLRRGGRAIIDVSGLNLQLDGGSLSGNMFAAVGRDLLGGAASGDEEPEIYSDSRLGLFINGNVAYGERDPSKNNSGFKLDINGITAGMDYRITDKLIAGVAVGYSRSDLDYANDGGVLEGNSTFYSAYSSFYSDKNYYIDSSITYADSDFDVTRHIKYRDTSGLVDLQRSGNTGGDQLLATIDFGWDYNDGPWTFGPNGSFSYSDTSIDGFAERGESGLELQYSGQANITSTFGLGFHGSRVFLLDWGVLIANLNGNYYREFKNQNSIIRASFVHDPFRYDSANPTSEMLIVSDIPDRNYFNLGIGLAAQFKYGLSGFVDYQTLLAADNITSRELAFGLRYEAKF